MSENETLQNKKSFFADKHNIFSLIAIGSALLAIIFYLVLPVINIGLTPDGKALATLIEDKKMLEYSQTLNGIKVVFGQGTYDVYHNVGSSAVRETQALAFNVPLLIALLLLFVSACGLCFLMVTHKNNIWNKFILAGFIIGTILLLLTTLGFFLCLLQNSLLENIHNLSLILQ